MSKPDSRMTNKWRTFCAFVRRGARFLSSMKKRNIRRDFEQYLQTIGRDPTVYKDEGWSEVRSTEYDLR